MVYKYVTISIAHIYIYIILKKDTTTQRSSFNGILVITLIMLHLFVYPLVRF